MISATFLHFSETSDPTPHGPVAAAGAMCGPRMVDAPVVALVQACAGADQTEEEVVADLFVLGRLVKARPAERALAPCQ